MTLNMQKQTKSNSTGNTDSIRYMAQMFGNNNIIQIMLQMRHMLSIATQLPVTTTIIHDTTELKTVFYRSVVITIYCDHTYAVSSPKKVFVLFLLLASSFPASIEKENPNNLFYK